VCRSDIFQQIKQCGCSLCPECRQTPAGREYTGTLSTTVSGRTCQAWSSETPHELNLPASIDANYAEGSRAEAKNYCRNPDPSWLGGVWCYTTDPNMRWEMCNVPLCSGK